MTGVLNRRGFLVFGTLASGALLVGCSPPTPASRLGDQLVFLPRGTQVALNGWVKITPDDKVIVAAPRSEMGQGVHTALAMLVAEELDASWAQVSVEAAPIADIYANTALLLNISPFQNDDDGLLARMGRASLQRLGYALSLQVTGGSSSVRDAWEPMRLAGATARAMLVQAAAIRWGVAPEQCTVDGGVVSHKGSGRKARFGELVQAAGQLSPPLEAPLKAPGDFRLIGKPMPRIDIPAKTDGSAVFGIDVTLPGMLHAAIRQCPVFGGTVKSFDAKKVLSLPGVRQVLQIGTNAVVVVADNTWRARQAIEQLPVQWDEGPNAKLNSAAISAQLRTDLEATAA